MKNLLLIIFLFLPYFLTAQEIDIIPYLKALEEGKKDEVLAKLPSLQKQNPNDPSVMFLEGILNENADEAVKNFNMILERHPKSKYADAALYRIYSYYFALGLYNSAEKHLNRLRSEYPNSPYIKIAERNIPEADEPDPFAQGEKNAADKETKTEENYKYTVQAGAFSNKQNSAMLVNEFRAAGYAAEIKEKLVAGTTFEIVYVGKFNNEREAREFLKRINDEYNLDGRVVSIKNED